MSTQDSPTGDPSRTTSTPLPAGKNSIPERPAGRRGVVDVVALLLGMAVALAVTTGCATNKGRVTMSTEGPYDLTLVLPGDVLNISFPGATNYNAQLKVPMDGEVRLPAAFGKPVNALGKTRAELEKAILAEIGAQLRTPEVNVSLIQSAAVVYVSGAVTTPTKVPMNRPLTLLDALMEAGGPTSRAKLDSVSVVRNFNGVQSTFVVDMGQAFSGGDVMIFYLRPFDAINVPTRVFNF